MATYKSTCEVYAGDVLTAAEWQKKFHDELHIGYKPAADMWKQKLAAGEFVVADGVARKPVVRAVKKKDIVEKKVEVGENAKVVKDFKTSDPNDPHHYALVKEEYDTEKERDERILEIKKDPIYTYVSRGWGDKKFNVTFWKQID